MYLGVALWIGFSVPFGLIAGAAIRGRRRRVIDVTDKAVPSSPPHAPASASAAQLTDPV
jgi:hypothetical protein